MADDNYNKMWEDFGASKSQSYLDYKFTPTHRVGLTNHLRELLIYELLEPSEEDIVLDAGCAAGRQLFYLADRIKAGHGTDIASSFIDQANQHQQRQGIANLFFRQATVEQLPYGDETFDKVICAEILEHVHDKDVVIRELLRVLKDQGILIITVPNLNADGTWWGRLLRALGLRKFQPIEHFSEHEISDHGDAHVREYEKHGLAEWLAGNNLEVLEVKTVSFIDGPGFDFLLKFPLHVSFAQKLIIKFERWLTKLGLVWGRHLAIKARKFNNSARNLTPARPS